VRDGKPFSVQALGGLVVNDRALLKSFALAGLGLASMADLEVAADVAAGRLEAVLANSIPSDSGLFLYFPRRTQSQPKLRAFIDLAIELIAGPRPGSPASKTE
jgi:DNA-binding transcriptional LysR family regulator